ncbi:hypothetical protein EYZ11_011830 [Aspergillus tanneri]|uniref:IEC3 subunit of the Ino80 complex, chromatin re-modelling-domain-containing protein n=1 Tax=Aspergillus tanneri TaxID=1220188 RepID=A0A4S3J3X5_9EURO|nr:uncharacterized protein ATNIH1004_006904 [Aspergillus tanneri]KAA8645485.1 hypothetical protein ATNIH1004_006904 [Aspergillus tanneri]THC88718.1 hypothetical protein EYZ11_011830 [Aspergillus tanneri]
MSQDADDTRSVAESLPDAPTKQSYRSFKKKFAKLKVNFELRMKESEALVREELRIQDLSNRIQEQNDQLLEVLLEFNDSLHIPPNLRFNLSTSEDASLLSSTGIEDPAPSNDPEVAASMLRHAKDEVAAGQMTAETYHGLEESIKRGKAFEPQLEYASLVKVPHTVPQTVEEDDSAGVSLEHRLGFFTPEHETEYYFALDARLGDETAALHLSRAPDKPSFHDRERDAALRNSISVYNWLRRNQPHIFLQDNENASEKSGSRPSNLRASKKVAPQPRKDEDDDDSVLMDTGPTFAGAKGKRKRDEDGGSRSKGSGSRSNRKKKDDTTPTAKRPSKRSSGVGA